MDEMDMRFYDVAIARWVVLDPVTHFDYSPYQAFDNNPIFWGDPDGADAIDPRKDSVTTIHSYVDRTNTTYIVQTKTTTTVTVNEDGSSSVSYSSTTMTNKVDAYGKVTKGTKITESSGIISKNSEGEITTSNETSKTRDINSSDKTNALNQWTEKVSEYNKENESVYNKDMINKTSEHTTNATRAGVLVLSVFGNIDDKVSSVLAKKLGPKMSNLLGIVGVPTSADALVSMAGEQLNKKIGENNNYTILYGVEHIQNDILIKAMKTPSGGGSRKRVGPTSWQDLWEGIKSIFSSDD